MKIIPFNELGSSDWEQIRKSRAYQLSQQGLYYQDDFVLYNSAYFQNDNRLGFIVSESNQTRAIVFANKGASSKLEFFTQPVGVFVDDQLTADLRLDVEQAVVREIKSVCERESLESVHLPSIDFLNGSFLPHSGESSTSLVGYINLTDTEEMILRRMRKSYRSLLNWGKKNLKLTLISKENLNRKEFDRFKEFHIEVAGRQTRSDLSWDLQYKAIESGFAFLMNAELIENGKLVAGNLIVMGTEEAYYGVGVNDRNLMSTKMPIGHWPLVAAIFEARNRGRKTFTLGHLGPKFTNEKEESIALFKKGFSNLVRSETSFTYNLKTAASIQE